MAVPAPPVHAANDDAHLLRLWLHGKSPNTRDAYGRDVRAFLESTDSELRLPLPHVTLQHVQDWADALAEEGLAPSTRARKLSAVKSLLAFGHRTGYLAFNVGAAVSPPKSKDRLSERILPEAAVHRVLAVADAAAESGRFTDRRNAVLLRLFYASGGRVSELAALRWEDALERAPERGRPTGQVTLFGKGEETRRVLLSTETWAALMELRVWESETGFGTPDAPVFRSTKGGDPAHRIRGAAAFGPPPFAAADVADRERPGEAGGPPRRRQPALAPSRPRQPRARPRRPAPPRAGHARAREPPDDLALRPRPPRRFFRPLPRRVSPPVRVCSGRAHRGSTSSGLHEQRRSGFDSTPLLHHSLRSTTTRC